MRAELRHLIMPQPPIDQRERTQRGHHFQGLLETGASQIDQAGAPYQTE